MGWFKKDNVCFLNGAEQIKFQTQDVYIGQDSNDPVGLYTHTRVRLEVNTDKATAKRIRDAIGKALEPPKQDEDNT